MKEQINQKPQFKVGDWVKVSPKLTNLKEWVEGEVIKVRENPFIGIEIAIKDSLGRIFFGEQEWFKSINDKELCTP